MSHEYKGCATCIEYIDARAHVLAPAFTKHRAKSGETASQILERYMTGVHQRHLSGLPILKVARS